VTGDALKLAAEYSTPIGGLGDPMRAVRLPDISDYVSPDVGFGERAITQHSRVQSHERLADRHYILRRHGLGDVNVVFLNEYELMADHLRTARSRYGHLDMLVMTNPNGRATSSAEHVGEPDLWVEGIHGSFAPTMTVEEISERIKSEAAQIAEHVPGLAWYLFGSALVGSSDTAADIDVLVLYSHERDSIRIRGYLTELCLTLPVHLLLVSRDEDTELSFVATQPCRQLYP